ncbi:DUF2264 domain-containing protein [Streptomyces sp. B6B3]|uniref:DUF2264 domain-containing protein n=1 Tax=Streptomyces sp. B6B3 TaxID=3153570 RepID=UPI00325D9D9B
MTTDPHPATPPLVSPAPPLDHELSPLTGWTRSHWEWAADAMLAAVRRYANDSGSLLALPGPVSGSGEWSDGLEGYARTFLLAAFRSARADPAHAERVLRPYASGLAAGTDPDSPERWPRVTEVMQARVEAASIAIGLHETRHLLWDRLDQAVRDRTTAWLGEMSEIRVPDNNWVWFRAVVAAFLRSVGAPHSAADIAHAISATDGWYVGDGWYTDGGVTNFDHYNGWAMHLYPLWYSRISGIAADQEPLTRYRDRLCQFLTDAQHLVSADGSPLFQGRSLTYRFAAAAPFFAGALFDATPLPPGRARRAASGMLRHFLDRGATAEDGVLSLGWHHRFEGVRQRYSGPASPYWASKGFVGLLLPPDHPVWTATEDRLPVERGDFTRALAAPGWLVSGTVADGVVRVANHGTSHVHAYEPFYSRPAYSTHTAPDMDSPGPAELERVSIGNRTAASRVWGHLPGPQGPGGGVLTLSAVNGPWEIRLTRTDAAPVRITGHTIAAAEPPTDRDGVVRRVDGLTSAVLPLHPNQDAEVGVHRAEDANPFGRHSATPVYESATDGWHAVAVHLGHTADDATLPPAPTVTLTPDTATVAWSDGTTDTLSLDV